MIVDCAVYRAGARLSGDIHGGDLAAAHEAITDGDFLWIGLFDPTAEELEHVASVLELHPLAVEDAVNAHQRPKLERYGDDLFMVLRPLSYYDETDQVETSEISIFVGRTYLVSVRHGEGIELSSVRRDLESKSALLGHGPLSGLYAICDRVVDLYGEVVDALETDIEEIEASVFSDERTKDAERIYTLKREVLEVRRAVLPLRNPMHLFATGAVNGVPDAARPFFRDVADHIDRVAEAVDSAGNLLDAALNAHMTRVAVQQNDDMRKISAGAALLLGPTLVAGVYGMNFDRMPELHWALGYPMAIVMMAAVVGVLWWFFKRSGWL